MDNPFDQINERLANIENMLLDVLSKNQVKQIYEPDSVWIELPEAAKLLHISKDRLYKIHFQIFNTRKPGNKVLFSKKEVLAYLDGSFSGKRAVELEEDQREIIDFRMKKKKYNK